MTERLMLVVLVCFVAMSAHSEDTTPDAEDRKYFVRILTDVDDDLKLHYLAEGIQFELPGVEPGDLKSAPAGPLLRPGSYVLFNGYPGQPGVTPISQQFTWVVNGRIITAKEQNEKTEEVKEGSEIALSSESNIRGKISILKSPYVPKDKSEAQKLDKAITAIKQMRKKQGVNDAEQPPYRFLFHFARETAQIELSMTGSPPDGTTPEKMALAIARSLTWTKGPRKGSR